MTISLARAAGVSPASLRHARCSRRGLPACAAQLVRAASGAAAGKHSGGRSRLPPAPALRPWNAGGNGSGGGASVRLDELDSIMVLAGGQLSATELPTWVERRLDTALALQQAQRDRPCPIVLLGGGTPHKPPFTDERGYVIHESTACASYLMARGADARTLLKETASYDTVGNAFFSLWIHALPAGYRRIGVVTSDFHMPRTAALFTEMYGLAAREMLGDPHRFELVFVAASDEGLFDADVLQTRKEKEAAAAEAWLATARQLRSVAQLHEWFHSTHLCYAVSRQHEFGVSNVIRDPKLLASY